DARGPRRADRGGSAAAHGERPNSDAGAQSIGQDAAHAARVARREVCYVGQTIAVAIADNRYLAEDAAATVNVEFEALPAVSDCRDAARAGAPPAHSDLATNVAAVVAMSYGEVDAAFAHAAHVFEEELALHRGGAMTLEGRAVLASYDAASDMLTVWSATQT